MLKTTTSSFAFAFLLLACSSSSSSSGGGAGDGVAVPIATAKSGTITVFQAQSQGLAGTSLTCDASALFYSTYDAGSAPTCKTTQYGSCLLHTCDTAVTSDTTKATAASAGTITVKGLTGGDEPLSDSGAGTYSSYMSQFAGFAAGAKIESSAPGDPNGAPAFDVTTTAPDDVVISAPTFDPDFQIAHYHAGDDLPVAWTPITNGQVQVDMINAPNGVITQLSCTWDGAAGSATVPGGVIALLGGDAGGYDTGFYALSSTTTNPGGWTITQTLQTRAYAPGKTALAGGTLELD